MSNKYQDAYPEKPILDSIELTSPSALALLTLEYFEAKPGTMENQVYDQHHVVINLKEEPHRVENWRKIWVEMARQFKGHHYHSRAKPTGALCSASIRRFAQ